MAETNQALSDWHTRHTAWMEQWGQKGQEVLSGLEPGLRLLEESNALMQLSDMSLADSLQLYRDANALTQHLQQALDMAQQELETLQAGDTTAPDTAQD